MRLRVQKLHPDAKLPTYGTLGAACFDLHALEGGMVSTGAPFAFRTGLAFEVPEDHVMLIFSRSGHGFNSGVRLANCVGVIDSDYRGEVLVKLGIDKLGGSFAVEPGDRIAQAMLLPAAQATFEEVGALSETDRGAGGFGSTGA